MRRLASIIWPFSGRVHFFHWTRTLAAFVSFQLVVQVIGLFSGLMIVRSLSKEEYAIYTVAGSALALVANLSDLGISGALLALGGKVFQNDDRLGQLIKTALSIRWAFFSVAAVVGGAFFFSLGLRTGANVPYILLVFVLLLGGGIFNLNYNVWSIIPRLRSQVSRIQKLDVVTASIRLALILVAPVVFLNTAVVVAINSLGLVIQGITTRLWGLKAVSMAPPASDADRKDILKLASRQMPNMIFYCVYGQVTVIVIAVFGNASQVAEFGALSRLGAIFGILSSMLSTIIMPRFACVQRRHDLAKRYVQVVAIFLAGAFGLLALALTFPKEMVWLLGGKYAGLENLIGWVVGAALANGLVGVVWSLNTSKGWTRHVWITIPVMVVSQVFMATQLDLSTVRGAIILGAAPTLSSLVILIPIASRGIRSTPLS